MLNVVDRTRAYISHSLSYISTNTLNTINIPSQSISESISYEQIHTLNTDLINSYISKSMTYNPTHDINTIYVVSESRLSSSMDTQQFIDFKNIELVSSESISQSISYVPSNILDTIKDSLFYALSLHPFHLHKNK